MFEHILVPLDGSSAAEAILPKVQEILRKNSGDVVLLRVVVPEVPEIDSLLTPEELARDAKNYILNVERSLVDSGIRAKGITRVGNAPETILDIAHEEKSSLLAMSTHGRSGISRWVFGSVTEKVLRIAPVPILIVRSFGAVRPLEPGIRTILVPLDGSALSEKLLPAVKQLAPLFHSHVILLHVLDRPDPGREREMESRLSRLAGEITSAGAAVTTMIRNGDAASQILDVCASSGVDLIAMTTHGRSGVSRWVFGSVTEKVLRAATTPMLVTRDLPL
jgi:nucleotide-binding universal stress UspA family protein